MPSLPKYCRQREKGGGRRDRAYCRIDGKKVPLGTYGSSESRQLYAEVIAKLDDSPTAPKRTGPPTIVEVMAAYWRYIETYHERKSPAWYHVRMMMRWLREHHGDELAEDFRSKKLMALRDRWIAEGWSRDFINQHVARVKRMFEWAVAQEMVPAETYGVLSTVKGLRSGKTTAPDNPPVEPVSDSDVEATLEHLPEPVACMVKIQRWCGCRPGEITTVCKKDIDRSGDIWVAELEKHKTRHHGKRRFIYFGPRAQELLLPRLVCADDDRLFPMRRDSYRRTIHRACERAGIPNWSPNQLRHAAGTEAREKLGLEAAQLHLGHSRADVTQIYAETSKAKALEVARRLG